jgi:predicted permease
MTVHQPTHSGDPGASSGNEMRVDKTARGRWRSEWLDTTWMDIRYALRALRRQPGFTLVVVLTLALGIGANTAVFSVLSGVVLRPLPYPEPDRLEFVMTTFPSIGADRFAFSLPEFLEFRDHNSTFESTGAYVTGSRTLGSSQPSRHVVAAITPGILPTLGVRPSLGRWIEADDARPGADPVVMLSTGIWQQTFGADPSVIGRRVEVDGTMATVVGVMPPGHDERIELWVPLTIDPAQLQNERASHNFRVIARRRPGVTRAQAQADLDRLVSRWQDFAPGRHTPGNPGHGVWTMPLIDQVVGDVRSTLWILQAAVAVVMLIACVNLANLLIARADSRAQEYALRVALGASRWRLLGQLTTEGLLLSGVAALVGIGLAQTGLTLLLSAYPNAIPRVGDITVDERVLGFTVVLAIATALVFGLVPFVHLARHRIGHALRHAGTRMTAGRARTRVRSALIVAEVALAVLLVAGAGLLLRSFVNMTNVDVGFDRAGLSTFQLSLPQSRYGPVARVDFYHRLVAALEALPGVDKAAAMSGLPPQRGSNSNTTNFAHIPDNRPPGSLPEENVDFDQYVSVGYVETMNIPVAAGRSFQDVDVNGAPTVLVNEALVRTFFGGRDPIGQRLRPFFAADDEWFTIIGVLEDVKQDGVAEDVGTEAYYLIDQRLRLANQSLSSMHLAIRSSLPLETLAGQIRRTVAELDAALPVTGLRTMNETIDLAMTRPRFVLMLLGVLAGLALSLAAVGIYGILAYLVEERRQEIGIRMALGATRQRVVGLVLARGLGATIVGLACGILASLALTGVLTSLLFEVSPTDPVILGTVCATILVVAAVACIVPAWRASRVNPMTAVRS